MFPLHESMRHASPLSLLLPRHRHRPLHLPRHPLRYPHAFSACAGLLHTCYGTPCLRVVCVYVACHSLDVHGPALKQKAIEATALVDSNLVRTLILSVILGSLPALFCVLIIEGFYVRWRQRMSPSTPDEAKLQETIKRGLRRRMLQTGLSLWLGGVLFALSVPPRSMFGDGSWPNDGVGYWP